VIPRLVKTAIVSIAILVSIIFIAAYWLAWRPLPKISGTIAAPVSGPATISRDALGVPHIKAASIKDALFLQGFATAQDRLWQMDNFRRFAAGDLSEVYGVATLPTDRLSRAMGMRRIAEHHTRSLPPEQMSFLTAYASGVNFYIHTSRGRWSLEFWIPHPYQPRDWTPVDSMLVLLMMFRDLTTSWQTDLARCMLFASAKSRARAEQLFPVTQGGYVSPGSNSWAVSGAKARLGGAMLASDPHLGYSIPSVWHMVHLESPDLNVIGVALPAVPGVTIGHNENIAWGMTNIGADYQDLYEEQINFQTGEYVFRGKPRQAVLDRQTIQVRAAKPVELKTWITVHGPIIVTERGKNYALRWTAADRLTFPGLDVNRARSWHEFRDALRGFRGPPQNVTYADRQGNIGYQATGAMPIRPNFRGNVPIDGSSGENEWAGYVPFESLPSYSNPPNGVIATANQNPFPPDFPYPVEGSFADPYRVNQIHALLRSSTRFDVRQMLAIESDVYSAFHKFLADRVLLAFDRLGSVDPLVEQTIPLFRKWNGQMVQSNPAPLVTELLNRRISAWLIGSVAPGSHVSLSVRPYQIQLLMEQQPKGWVDNDSWDRWLLHRLSEVLSEGVRIQGNDISQWRYSKVMSWNFLHPIGSHIPVVNRFFDIGPIGMSGAGTTVKQISPTMGPSMRMIVDWADIDRSVQNIAVGESGHIASLHYKDQWEAFYEGRSFSMKFNRIEPKDVLRITPE
jgi:penicillin G amidase